MREMISNNNGEGSSTKLIFIIIGIVCAILLVGSIVFMGVTFLWAQSFTEDVSGGVDTLNVDADIDGTENELEITSLSGFVDWSEYNVMVDGIPFTTTSGEVGPGEPAIFTSSGWNPEPGMEYNVKIVKIDNQKLVWDSDIRATA